MKKIVQGPGNCGACYGSGKIANDEDHTPWPIWEALEPPENIALTMGLVQPIKCDICNGTGTSPNPLPALT